MIRTIRDDDALAAGANRRGGLFAKLVKASLEGTKSFSPIRKAAQNGADESVRLLAYLGARLYDGYDNPFWRLFPDNKGRVRDPALWERIVQDGGNEGTEESLRKRIRMLKEAKVHDPRDGTSW